jgi:hypothetical protein
MSRYFQKNVYEHRLDFDSFNIAQPSIMGICNNDQFIVSGSTTAIPIVCGVNTGNHSEYTYLIFWSKNQDYDLIYFYKK